MHITRSAVSLLVLACVASAAPFWFTDSLGTDYLGIKSRNVPPAGSDLFNPGTLSHPWTPVTGILEEFVKDETGQKSPLSADTQAKL